MLVPGLWQQKHTGGANGRRAKEHNYYYLKTLSWPSIGPVSLLSLIDVSASLLELWGERRR